MIQFGLTFGGDVGDESFKREQISFVRKNAAPALPDPFLCSVGGANAVGQFKLPPFLQRGLNRLPDGKLIIGMDDLAVADFFGCSKNPPAGNR